MIKFSELKPGKIYSLYSKQFGSTNVCKMICFDITDLNRKISYWQFAERGHPIMTEAKLKQLTAKNIEAPGVFALWDWEFTLGGYEAKLIKPLESV